MTTPRFERRRWTDIVMARETWTQFMDHEAELVVPDSQPAIPAIWNAQLSGFWAAGDTITVGATTYTAVEGTPTGNQFSVGTWEYPATPSDVVNDLKRAGIAVTGFTVFTNFGTLAFQQTVAGTGDQPTVAFTTANSGSVELTQTQLYAAAVAGKELQLIPGDALYLISTDGNTIAQVTAIDVTVPAQVAAFHGFCRDYITLKPGETLRIAAAVKRYQLSRDNLPTSDPWGHLHDWHSTANSLIEAASRPGKEFQFGWELPTLRRVSPN